MDETDKPPFFCDVFMAEFFFSEIFVPFRVNSEPQKNYLIFFYKKKGWGGLKIIIVIYPQTRPLRFWGSENVTMSRSPPKKILPTHLWTPL